MVTSDNSFNGELLESIFRTSKKTIQEYVREIERNNRYRSCRQDISSGYILDDRARLIDLYEACLQQDAHIRSVVETLESQILGDRYMLAHVNGKGKYTKDVVNSQKIQGSQFDKIIKGIVEAKLYGYTLLEIMPYVDSGTGRLAEVAQCTAGPESRIEKAGAMGAALGFAQSGLPPLLCAGDVGGPWAFFCHNAIDTRQKVHGGQLC